MLSVQAPTIPSFADSVAELLGATSSKAIRSDRDREDVYRLRYAAYSREGALPPGAPKLFKDRYDDSPHAVTLGVYVEGCLASSIRLHIGTRDCPDIPAMQVFSDYLLPRFQACQVVVDPTRFVVDDAMARRFPKLPYITVRLAWMASAWFNADVLLATVRAEHQAFYRRLLGHKVACPARPYPMLTKAISLMDLDCVTERKRVEQRYPFFASSEQERASLFGKTASRPSFPALTRADTPSCPGSLPVAPSPCHMASS